MVGFRTPEVVEKPWGLERHIAVESEYVGKVIEVRAGERLSLQYHERKKETMYLLSGKAKLIVDDEEFDFPIGSSITISPGMKHRLIAVEDIQIIEVSTTELDDVVHVEDDYGRK
jgi:mannose-6-phosphate isomerase-like protein (cupin superfamily)